MKTNTKTYLDKSEFGKAHHAFNDYQKRHNLIRNDYELLLKITELKIENLEEFNTLYRASLKGILSLIESDIYGLNSLDKYENYSDKHSFEDKFKKTFKQICRTWEKEAILKEYLDTKYSQLKSLKIKRDKLIHPKKSSDIPNPNFEDFKKLKETFFDYTKMIHSLMDNFFISVEVQNVKEFFEIIKKDANSH